MEHGASFYVDDYKTASLLLNCNRKITTRNGFNLVIKVNLGFPEYKIDNNLRETLKLVIAKRYIKEKNALNLSKFHRDQGK